MAVPAKLRPASFRGAPFQVAAIDSGNLAQRAQVHQYPERDDPYVEVLGLDTPTYAFDAYTLGDAYLADRDALISAVREKGAGQLIHPSLGERTVVCIGCSLRESVEELGLARLALTFVEAGLNRFPTSSPLGTALIPASADTASTTAQQTFSQYFSLEGAPQWVADHAAEVLAAAQEALTFAVAGVPKAPDAGLGEVMRDLSELTSAAGVLLGDPAGLASQLSGIIAAVGEISAGPLATMRSLEALAHFGEGFEGLSVGSPSRDTALANQYAMTALVTRTSAIEAARRTPEVELDSYGDAVALRDRLSQLLDDQITAAADALQDDDAQAMRDLRAQMVRDLTLRAGQLRVVQIFVPIDTVPAALIAQRLYGDALRADEIVARNPHIEHPGFVPGGVTLEVLSA